MSNALRYLYFATSITAAILWLWSALVHIPEPTFDMDNLMAALDHAARLNAWAAGTTGVSVALSIAREWFQKT
jgi:hypothetical protein